ncbi:MAG: choice-of-anchor T family protein [Thermoplasmatota archaeon]
MSIKNTTFVLALMMAVSSLLIICTDDTHAIGAPAITVELDQAKIYASCSPDEGDNVTFRGNVTVVMPWNPEPQSLIVELEVDAGNFSASEIPQMVFDKNTTTLPFSFDVMVPSATRADISHDVSVAGEWSYDPGVLTGNIDPTNAIIVVETYFLHDLIPPEGLFEFERAELHTHHFLVENLGNSRDNIVLEIMNSEELDDDGLFVEPQGPLLIQYGEVSEYPMEISIDPDTRTGTYTIEGRIYSAYAQSSGMSLEYSEASLDIYVIQESQEEPPEEPEQSEEPEDDIDQLEDEDDNAAEEDQQSGGTGSEGGEEIETTVIFILFCVIVILVVMVGAYVIIRKGKKTGT